MIKRQIESAIFIPAALYALMTIIINLNFRLYDYINMQLFPYLKSTVDIDMFEYLMQHSHAFFQNNFAGNLTKKMADMAENIEPLISIPNEWFYPRLFAHVNRLCDIVFCCAPSFWHYFISMGYFIYLCFVFYGAKIANLCA